MNLRIPAVFILMALGLVCTAIIANAPEGFPFLWELKAAAASFTGIAGLLLSPDQLTPKKP